MNIKQRSQKWIPVAMLVLISLACSTITATTPQSVSTSDPRQVEPTKPIESTKPVESTNTPEPSPTPTPAPIGLSRNNPIPRSELVSAPNWDVQILEVKRGEDAWQDVQAANMFNEAAPEGKEYLLVKIYVKSTYADSEEHSISSCDFAITGDKLINYTCGMANVVAPDPQLDARLFANGEAEGWAAYLISQGESNLILVFDETFNFEDSTTRYIAIDDGASVSIPPDLTSIKSTNAGKERITPASREDKAITEDWEFSIKEVVRGDDALKKVQEANQFNELPADGFEYIAVKIQVRYISVEDKAANIDKYFFKTTGSENVLYDAPSVVDPNPSLNASLYPGGEYEGWVVLQVARLETGIILVFEPLFDFSGNNRRFISLEP